MGIAEIETQGTSTMTAWSVYIVRCADGTLYTGISTDVAARIAAHNRGSGAKYTRSRMPVELVYQEPAFDRGAAQKREHEIRRLTPEAKRALAGRGAAATRVTLAAQDLLE